MIIRAFLSTWSGVKGGDVITPIHSYLENRTELVTCWMHWPDANTDGLPDKNRVLVIVRGPLIIEQLGNLVGVKMLPAYRFDKPISEIPQAIKDVIKTAIVAEGIPLSALAGIEVYGDFMRKVAKYFNPNHKGFGSFIEVDLAGEFG